MPLSFAWTLPAVYTTTVHFATSRWARDQARSGMGNMDGSRTRAPCADVGLDVQTRHGQATSMKGREVWRVLFQTP